MTVLPSFDKYLYSLLILTCLFVIWSNVKKMLNVRNSDKSIIIFRSLTYTVIIGARGWVDRTLYQGGDVCDTADNHTMNWLKFCEWNWVDESVRMTSVLMLTMSQVNVIEGLKLFIMFDDWSRQTLRSLLETVTKARSVVSCNINHRLILGVGETQMYPNRRLQQLAIQVDAYTRKWSI